MAKNTKLWGGRFEGTVEDWVERFGASISFDQKLAKFDVIGSLAHVQMLGQTGILSLEESEKIQVGLKELLEELEAGQLDFDIANEDIHMNMEVLLTEKIGPLAGKLHTARSRNDQVATDMHLYLKEQLGYVLDKLAHLKGVLLDLAENHVATIMPGYTHLQHAQPISFAYHLMAYYNMFQRDSERFEFNQKHTDLCPLGAAALAGTISQETKEGNISLYKVMIELETLTLKHGSETVVLQKDMPVEVRIVYDKETYLDWILEMLSFKQ
ncbi:TPA: lyase family protein [Streptococcus pneumoniae]